MLAEGEINFGEKHSTRCPWRLFPRPPQPMCPRTLCQREPFLHKRLLLQSKDRLHPASWVCAWQGLHLDIFNPFFPFPSNALLSNALIGCSLFIFIFFPCGSKCLNFFFFNFRKLKTEGGMLLESVTQKKGFALQPSVAPGDSSIKKVVFHCSWKAVIFYIAFRKID